MSTPRIPPEGPYSQLTDDDGEFVEHKAHPGLPFTLAQRLRGSGRQRLVTMGLAALCAVLLVTVIAVAAHYRNTSQKAGEEASVLQKQTQDALSATVNKLQEDKEKLQKDKEQLQENKEQLQKDKEQLQKDKEQLQKDKEQLQKEKEQLQENKEQLQKDNEQLQKDKEQLLARLAATKAPEAVRPTTRPVTCPMNWEAFGGSCYFISTMSRDWESAQSFCQQHGAHLAIILTAEEQTFLWNLLPRGHWNSYWFGITDEHTEDQWKWVDGTALVEGFWEVGEPNNHIDEDCGNIVKTNVMERVAIRSWYDAPCSMYRPFICEKELDPSTSA